MILINEITESQFRLYDFKFVIGDYATYNSYFNTYYGSYMGFVFKKKGSIKKLSSKIKNIKNMRYVTYWQTYMGGLPIAARLGEAVVKHL